MNNVHHLQHNGHHLSTLNSNPHVFDHSLNSSKSLCMLSNSSALPTLLNNLVSSANFKIRLTKSSSRSLMTIKKNNGPRTDPCGTPEVMSIQSDCMIDT